MCILGQLQHLRIFIVTVPIVGCTEPPAPILSSPRPLSQQSPLPEIEEEDDFEESPSDETPSYKSTKSSTESSAHTSSRGNSSSATKKRPFLSGSVFSNSPSPVKFCATSSTKGRTKGGKARKTRSVQSSVSSEGSGGEGGFRIAQPPKMQAEQGSIGDLHKYHGRYLKNRRHTLANVR